MNNLSVEQVVGLKVCLTEREAAKYIGFSTSFLRQARSNGKIGLRAEAPPFIKIGSAVRYVVSDLDSWLLNQKRFQHSAEARIHQQSLTLN